MAAKIKSFEVAARGAADDGDGPKVVPFQLEGDERIYEARKFKTASLALVWTADAEDAGANVTAIYDFMGGPPDRKGKRPGGVLTAEDFAHIHARLMDPLDGLDVEHLSQVFRWVIGEFSGSPST